MLQTLNPWKVGIAWWFNEIARSFKVNCSQSTEFSNNLTPHILLHRRVHKNHPQTFRYSRILPSLLDSEGERDFEIELRYSVQLN